MMSATEKKRRLDGLYGPQYDKAIQIALGHGFTTVIQANRAILADAKVAEEFTRRQRTTIRNIANRAHNVFKRAKETIVEESRVTNAVVKDALIKVMNAQVTTATIPQSSGIPTAGGAHTVYRFPRKRAFDHNRDAILDEIGAYVSARFMGGYVGVYHYIDTRVDVFGATSATTDLWDAAKDLDIACNALADAYGLTKDGAMFVTMDEAAQQKIAERIQMVRKLADVARTTCWAIDATTNAMDTKQKEGAGGSTDKGTSTSTGADEAAAAG